MTYQHATSYVIGGTEIDLKVEFDFVPAQPEMRPSFACAGEPAVPAEVDVTSLTWSPQQKRDAPKENVWHQIERGALFDLITMDLYDELVDEVINRERPE